MSSHGILQMLPSSLCIDSLVCIWLISNITSATCVVFKFLGKLETLVEWGRKARK